ncbi:MAG TPA: hypothetical protein VNY52_04820, partial [Solirubrobacteraceae bacterium]|nr:hypothetical protein [Solirubrobacteraceae bacterium]
MRAIRAIGRRGALGAVCMVLLGGGAIGASPAYAEAPWWGLSSNANPTNLLPGLSRNEVQEVTVKATGGELILVELTNFKVGFFKWDATHEELQAGLEEMYGAGNVEVSGGPGDEQGTKPYVITFTGGLADKPVEPIFVYGGALSGPGAEARGSEKTRGRADGQIVVMAENLGNGSANGATAPITITDMPPEKLKVVGIEGLAGLGNGKKGPVTCSEDLNERPLKCSFAGTLGPYEVFEIRVSVDLEPGASAGEENQASAFGGGATASKTVARPLRIGGKEEFGIEEGVLMPEEFGGKPTTQAGSHPFQLTSIVTLNRTPATAGNGTAQQQPVADAKDIRFRLPRGLVGNPTPFPQCTDEQFSRKSASGAVSDCPPETAVGVADITFYEPKILGYFTSTSPVFNMVPQAGEPARFGFDATVLRVILDTSVRTGDDYGVTVSSNNISQIAGLLSSKITFWGVPGDPRHDAQRGWNCLAGIAGCAPLNALSTPPLLSLPTSCGGPLQAGIEADSWLAPKEVVTAGMSEPMPSLDGCNHLPFTPSISIAPDVTAASTPTGLTVGVHISQSAALNPAGLAESTLKDTTVALPEGLGLNPGGADGLESCSEAQIGFLPGQSSPGALRFTAGLPQPFCPDASKIGTVEIETPLLPNALKGAVYLAGQGANPFGSLVAMYIVAEDPVSGVLVKLPGEVALSATGQVTAIFKDTPDVPFETLRMHFFGGARAPLATPPLCGAYTTAASFTPWSGQGAVGASSTFAIATGAGGSPCHSPLPFAPSLTAGTTSIQAGDFSPFTMTMSREDGDQDLSGVQLQMPEGLSGSLGSVKLCPEPQADDGTCGPESLIGHTIVGVGVGGNPYTVTGGEVFITGPYKGAPYGLSIVNPAKAGPFDLGKVIVRAKIEVDPATAALRITTDTTGPYAIPRILRGIPLQIKRINVLIDRPSFTFNPTNCEKMAITGALTSTLQATSALSVPFQATNCAVLKFAPKFAVSASGKNSRLNGASLTVKLSYPSAPQGTQANIARVKVELPKQLPSRLTTLQKACTVAQFQANPAGCPATSIIGHARASTPILPVPLEGPAYFVSHGGEAFPSLIIALQGYGVTVDLVGTTFISKAGITSSTFKTVPDVPVSTFELSLPQGPYSALSANGNLCASKLTMPTEFLAQNGALINRSTPITVTGCPK